MMDYFTNLCLNICVYNESIYVLVSKIATSPSIMRLKQTRDLLMNDKFKRTPYSPIKDVYH